MTDLDGSPGSRLPAVGGGSGSVAAGTCEFRPHPLLSSGHAQTIAGVYWPGGDFPYRARSVPLPLPDGDRAVLHLDEPRAVRDSAEVVLLVHGLVGSHRSPYAARIAAKLVARGYRVARIDMRGCGDAARLAQRPAHAGRSDDLRVAIEFLGRQFPRAPLSAVGFSLGGNQLLKLLGESSGQRVGNLQRAMAVAAPIDLHWCTRNIQSGWNRLYDRNFLRTLVRQTHARKQLVATLGSVRLAPLPRNLYEFDDRVTAPLSGFRDARDYYERASSTRLLKFIEVPTRVLTACDDPLVPVEMFAATELSAAVRLEIVSGGGHLGFIARRGSDPDRRWLDWRIVDWLAEI